ncbi:Conserved oligomeric Golgi complex subunit 1 [Gossypium arboreum]|uniref:Conserved oligomeric Golgi complex subunit 1 n=2 Tax=Gossypium arboreum TaxID=29729 RepID=A0A0B0MW00_GOSAR|nr:uncharacterized protein LOC108464572 isoform X1 [Gossypium arboreum]KAK5846155.1 hypothetical protein PVK06_002427 [Gossypium arboreum]KHG03674.1 Conserved oligomeric Golgi complex subunit 1 [Gossypium arboreum]KHG17379.1 Conserved oligomeric Golgi complex subunit 1 [Gossypium arboreum]
MEEQKGRKQHRAKMEGTAGGAEAGSHSKRPRTDPERHKLYREIKNWMFEELQLVEIDYHEKLQELAENKNELERCRLELGDKENEIQQHKATLESQKASMELMEQTVVHIMAHLGLNCTSFKKMEEWFLAQKYVGDHQGSATVTANFQTSTADFCQPMALGQYQTSIAASTAAGSSFSSGVWINCAARSPFGTNDILSEYGDPNNIGNHFGSDLAGGPDYTSIVASSAAAGTSSAPPNGHGKADVWIKSDAANYDSCEFGVPNNEDFLCRDFCLFIDDLDGNNHENEGGPFPLFP